MKLATAFCGVAACPCICIGIVCLIAFFSYVATEYDTAPNAEPIAFSDTRVIPLSEHERSRGNTEPKDCAFTMTYEFEVPAEDGTNSSSRFYQGQHDYYVDFEGGKSCIDLADDYKAILNGTTFTVWYDVDDPQGNSDIDDVEETKEALFIVACFCFGISGLFFLLGFCTRFVPACDIDLCGRPGDQDFDKDESDPEANARPISNTAKPANIAGASSATASKPTPVPVAMPEPIHVQVSPSDVKQIPVAAAIPIYDKA